MSFLVNNKQISHGVFVISSGIICACANFCDCREQTPSVPYEESVTYNGSIRYLEHVVIQISVSIPNNTFNVTRGNLQINVTSPSGTRSTILHPRPFDNQPGGYIDWPFMSLMFWGENPTGQWTLSIMTGNIRGIANVSKVEFQFYGVSEVPEAVANIPAQCHSDCRRGCAREGSNYCDSCVNLRNAHTLECIDQCPTGYTQSNKYCYNASIPLEVCNSTLKNKETTEFTQDYEPLTCIETGLTECCEFGFCATAVFHPHKCFCDVHCHNFDDCCEDAVDTGCLVPNGMLLHPKSISHNTHKELGMRTEAIGGRSL